MILIVRLLDLAGVGACQVVTGWDWAIGCARVSAKVYRGSEWKL